ncbi:MAG: hypothetical protein V9H69_24995 [Anaerolineae bacterium]
MSPTNTSEQKNKPANRAMSQWLERQYGAPQPVHDGPEALAWDHDGLQAARSRQVEPA